LSARRVLCDASTLIALAAAGRLDFLPRVLGPVHITAAVADEVAQGPGASSVKPALEAGWLKLLEGKGPSLPGLGDGESSLIAAARPSDLLVLDDRAARLEAKARGLKVTGLLGVLVHGRETGALGKEEAVAALTALAKGDFRMTAELYAWAMGRLG
jgi:uncharacterized protein